MNNLLSYCGLTDGVMNPSEIDLPELSTFKVKNIQVEVAGSKWSKKKRTKLCPRSYWMVSATILRPPCAIHFAGLFLKELLEGSWTERQKLMSFSNVIPIYTVLNDGTAPAQCVNLCYLFSNFSCMVPNPNIFPDLNSNWSIFIISEKPPGTSKLFWPFTVRTNCSSDLKTFANSRPSASNFNFFFSALNSVYYHKWFWPFTVRTNCPSDLKIFAFQPQISKLFLDHLNNFFSQ